MKKFLLIFSALLCAMAAHANFSELQYRKFTLLSQVGIPASWNTWSDNQTPTAKFSSFFKKGDSYKIGTFNNSAAYAISNSSTVEGERADIGLVTPAIDITSAHTILTFDAVTYMSYDENTLDVYVSTKGQAREDFTEEDLAGTFKIPGNNVTSPAVCNLSLEKYAGQTVYIAFVNHSTDAGILGINNFLFQQYYIEIENATPAFVTTEGKNPVSLKIKAMVPGECNGINVEVSTKDGVCGSVQESADFSTLQELNVTIPECITIANGEIQNYTIKVTPIFDEARTVSITGRMICGPGFDGVCVEEEGTGENCAFCPFGAATLNKFSHDFGDRYIGIGVHCGDYSTGVMENPEYGNPYLSYMLKLGGDGFPFAMLNRKKGVTPYPNTEADVRKIIDTPSVIGTKIDKVTYDPDNNHRVTVDFSTQLCVNMSDNSYCAAVVLTADGLKAQTPVEGATADEIAQYAKWAQNTQGTKNLTEASVAEKYGADWWPYLVPFAGQALLFGVEYDHVGMGIWPDFSGAGVNFSTNWKAYQPQSKTISFDMPMQKEVNYFGVQDWKKTAVVVLILNRNTGEIVTAAKMKADDFEEIPSGVKGVSATADYAVNIEGNVIAVNAEAGANVQVYSLDGTCVASQTMTGSSLCLNTDAMSGLVLVRVAKGNNVYFKKLIVR